MPYVDYDNNGKIKAIYGCQQYEGQEYIEEASQKYKDKMAQEQKKLQLAELQTQIDELEKSQLRSIREVALNKSVTFAMGKLQSLDNQIAELREQIKGL